MLRVTALRVDEISAANDRSVEPAVGFMIEEWEMSRMKGLGNL